MIFVFPWMQNAMKHSVFARLRSYEPSQSALAMPMRLPV